MAVKICEKCGESNRENASVCVVCSTSLAHAAVQGTLNEDKTFEGSLIGNKKQNGGQPCSSCGERLAPGAIACKYCGKPVTRTPRKNTYYDDSSHYEEPGESSILLVCVTVLLAIVTIFIPLIGLIVGGVVAFNQNDTKKLIGIGLVLFSLFVIFVRLVIL